MMDSALARSLAQSTSEVDNGFDGWSSPLFKVALCVLAPSLSLILALSLSHPRAGSFLAPAVAPSLAPLDRREDQSDVRSDAAAETLVERKR